jgi:hypothetical protein
MQKVISFEQYDLITREVVVERLSMLDRAQKAVENAINFMSSKVQIIAKNIFPTAFSQQRKLSRSEVVAAITAGGMAEVDTSNLGMLDAKSTKEELFDSHPRLRAMGRFVLGFLLTDVDQLIARRNLDAAYAGL